MNDKKIFNPRAIWYLLTQKEEPFSVNESIIYSQNAVLIADVSKWEGDIDFVTMQERGIAGVIAKCGQGSAPDPKFATYWIAAKDVLPRGTYWFFDSRVSPQKQAQLWADLIRSDPGELMHFADFEENYGGSYGGWQNFKIFLQEFQRLSGLPDNRIGIYTGYYYWIAKVPVSEMDWFGRFDLWLASYNPPENVLIPRPWSNEKTILWQYTDQADGHYFGASSYELDLSHYVNGDLAHYQNRFGITIEPGGTNNMETWKVNVAGLNIRNAVNGALIGAPLVAGDLVFGVLDTLTQWVHFSSIQRLGQPAQTLDGWCAAFPNAATPYLVKVVSNPVSLPILNISLRADGYPPLDVEWKPLQ